ncbi:hypothetical protein GE09DRAFT_1195569 [Coniochaeta sp. 2T2.1]|nr:hypothetical protein GE09DRAFT_1195569 [Coniochaeta sp. 2T2.1]
MQSSLSLMSSSNILTTPNRKRPLESAAEDSVFDYTSRPQAPFASRPSLPSTVSTSSRSSTRSGRSSPTKKERRLRETTDHPISRILLSSPGTTAEDLPASIVQLIIELRDIGQGERGIIPDIFYDQMHRDGGALNPPRSRWFIPTTAHGEGEARYLDRRLRKVWRASNRCTVTSEHEPGWNDTVHGPLLDEAFDDEAPIYRRNITTTSTSPPYIDPDPSLASTKLDYALLLRHQPGSRLEVLDTSLPADRRPPMLHIDLSDCPRTPLIAAIETKSASSGKAGEAGTQLANFGRGWGRFLGVVADEEVMAGDEEVAVGRLSLADETRLPPHAAFGAGGKGKREGQTELPVLPLISVIGSQWSVSFAQRKGGLTLVWQDVKMGDTNTLQGCYFVLHCLRRIGEWADAEIRGWWERVLEEKAMGV